MKCGVKYSVSEPAFESLFDCLLPALGGMSSGKLPNVMTHRREKEMDIFAECLPGTMPWGRKAFYCHLIYHPSIWESRKSLQP